MNNKNYTKCESCKNEFQHECLKQFIITNEGTHALCPNCCVRLAICGFPFSLEGNQICDISGEKGAVTFINDDEKYHLVERYLYELLKRNLSPKDYFTLVEKYGDNSYLLHDDFYDPSNGMAMQPVED